MFKLSDVAELKLPNFNKISLILGIGHSLRFNCLLRFLKSLSKCTQFDLGLGCVKDGAPHSESLDFSSTPSRNKRLTSFLNMS